MLEHDWCHTRVTGATSDKQHHHQECSPNCTCKFCHEVRTRARCAVASGNAREHISNHTLRYFARNTQAHTTTTNHSTHKHTHTTQVVSLTEDTILTICIANTYARACAMHAHMSLARASACKTRKSRIAFSSSCPSTRALGVERAHTRARIK